MIGKKKIVTLLMSALVISVCMLPRTAKADADGDVVQIGIEYVQNYSGTGSPVSSNLSVASIASRVDQNIINCNSNWSLKYIWGNSDVWEKDFTDQIYGGSDYRLGDDVDLLVYTGHGVKPNTYGASDYSFIMNNQNNSYYAKQGQMFYGDRDLEWFVTFTCNFTNGSFDQMGRMFKGLHQLCGYSTDMTITSNAGERFSYWAANMGYPITTAYVNYGWATQNAADVNTIRVFRATQDWNDHLWGFGSVGSDPTAYTANASLYEQFEQNLW